MIRPLGNRVLVKPDAKPTETASGLAIPDSHFDYDMSGTVLMVGDGPASAHRVRQAMVKRFLALITEVEAADTDWTDDVCGILRRKLGEMGAGDVSEVRVGDRVAFPYTAGTVIEVDGERHLLMQEDQIVAVLETA